MLSRDVLVQSQISARDACYAHSYVVRELKKRDEATKDDAKGSSIFTLLFLYGSWLPTPTDDSLRDIALLFHDQFITNDCDLPGTLAAVSLQVDLNDESLDISIGDSPEEDNIPMLMAPSMLPAIAVLHSGDVANDGLIDYIPVDSTVLLSYLCMQDHADSASRKSLIDAFSKYALSMVSNRSKKESMVSNHSKKRELTNESTVQEVTPKGALPLKSEEGHALRIFVAGDRSHVGKSSVCLGLLGSLLRLNYPASSLAYIKPATQCEAPQLVTEFCKNAGIDCQPVGPIVFYKGFTRAFLAGETHTTDEFLEQAGNAVDNIAKSKRVVLIDGVGYPAVGSICGTDNAAVAAACGIPLWVEGHHAADNGKGTKKSTMKRHPAPVLLVGKSGVGDAVDSFNLCSSWFESQGVPVLGAVFNRLPLDGFYSVQNCKRAVASYFEQKKPSQMPFGFVPEIPAIAKSRETNGGELDAAIKNADAFVEAFSSHVDVQGILDSASTILSRNQHPLSGTCSPLSKRTKVNYVTETNASGKINQSVSQVKLTREQIEEAAKSAGAAGG
uniref:DRTGG domain-containing protein n=1 Tax=Odontella aurita TaxID=265563 RepID=A0A7S4JPS6_9STRA|mmetsp:Transcript_51161/g.153709  ORF Transcript_51161/g.153709 Transcript_51161/m.153709 type:complete len:558 (+) Transcript_51161:187-1860(+)|eukprot:CAMPEP_0113555490 /NCGR_PEP_ID=MMETSP0015_2-20120614/16742_1 /TAXON_ID=2838 /ORGANISM="Odontella" /LENGTH=557 /DNA_ID=CAMNT_0000456765 /DNA_START=119 /DNA_END=1792 /DNA_ORIENTATION=- /assembly_acc=CAM_ASM_000160